MVDILAVLSCLIIIILWIRESYHHSVTMCERDDAEDALYTLRLTLDRYRSEKIEAQAIADHAIEVIAEARDITTRTIYEARIKELERAFLDRRQREKDLQDEIEKLTGGI